MVSIISKTPSGVNQILIDAVLRESHSVTNIITQYPVEDGSIISDHVRQVTEVITIEFVTTNTPSIVNENGLESVAGNNTQIRADQENRIQLTFDTILQWAGYSIEKQDDEFDTTFPDVQILTITTGLKVYTNMIIKNAEIFRTTRRQGSIAPVITFQKFRRARSEFFLTPDVSNLNGKAANVENQAQKKQPKGKQKAKNVEDTSQLRTLSDFLFGTKKAINEITNVATEVPL